MHSSSVTDGTFKCAVTSPDPSFASRRFRSPSSGASYVLPDFRFTVLTSDERKTSNERSKWKSILSFTWSWLSSFQLSCSTSGFIINWTNFHNAMIINCITTCCLIKVLKLMLTDHWSIKLQRANETSEQFRDFPHANCRKWIFWIPSELSQYSPRYRVSSTVLRFRSDVSFFHKGPTHGNFGQNSSQRRTWS